MASSAPSRMAEMAGGRGGRVAVIGASGYGGLQTIRLLQGHPSLSVTFPGGERSADNAGVRFLVPSAAG